MTVKLLYNYVQPEDLYKQSFLVDPHQYKENSAASKTLDPPVR